VSFVLVSWQEAFATVMKLFKLLPPSILSSFSNHTTIIICKYFSSDYFVVSD